MVTNDEQLKGPWLTEDEMEAILATDNDAEFDRLFGRRNVLVRRLWSMGVAAAIAGVALFLWPDNGAEESVVASSATATVRVPPVEGADEVNDADGTLPNDGNGLQTATATRRQPCKTPSENRETPSEDDMRPDLIADELIADADITFAHAGQTCEGMMTAADSEFAHEEKTETSIYIDL